MKVTNPNHRSKKKTIHHSRWMIRSKGTQAHFDPTRRNEAFSWSKGGRFSCACTRAPTWSKSRFLLMKLTTWFLDREMSMSTGDSTNPKSLACAYLKIVKFFGSKIFTIKNTTGSVLFLSSPLDWTAEQPLHFFHLVPALPEGSWLIHQHDTVSTIISLPESSWSHRPHNTTTYWFTNIWIHFD